MFASLVLSTCKKFFAVVDTIVVDYREAKIRQSTSCCSNRVGKSSQTFVNLKSIACNFSLSLSSISFWLMSGGSHECWAASYQSFLSLIFHFHTASIFNYIILIKINRRFLCFHTASYQCAHDVKVVDEDEFNIAITFLQTIRHLKFSLRLCFEAFVVSSSPSVSRVKADKASCRRNEWSDRAREPCIS